MGILEVFTGISAGVKEKGLSAVMEWQEKALTERERLRQEAAEAAKAYRESRAAAVEKITQKIADLTAEGKAAEEQKKRLSASLAIATAHDDQDAFNAMRKKLEKLESEKTVREDMITALRETTVFGSEDLFKDAEKKHSAYTDFMQALSGIYDELYDLADEQGKVAESLKDAAIAFRPIANDGFSSITGDEKGERIPAPEGGNSLPITNGFTHSVRIG